MSTNERFLAVSEHLLVDMATINTVKVERKSVWTLREQIARIFHGDFRKMKPYYPIWSKFGESI